MSDDGEGGAKEWVTVKLPKTVRDQGSQSQHTYGDIMQAGLTALQEGLVSLHPEKGAVPTKLDGDELQEHTGTARVNESYDEVAPIAAQLDDLKNMLSMTNDPTVDPDTEGMMEKLERIESGVSTVEDRTGRLERDLGDLTGGGRQ